MTGTGGYRPSPVCILAGGLGSRLGDAVARVPKPLLPVAGQPFLLHQLRLLADSGIRRVVLCVGYLGEEVESEIGEERFGMTIAYSYDGPGLDGTLGAIRHALPLLGERFLTLYGDTYLRVDYRAFDHLWQASGAPAAMTVLHNRGKWERSNAVLAADRIQHYNKAHPSAEMEWIDYGLGGLTAAVVDAAGESCSDMADLFALLAERNLVFGYEAFNRFYEIGTPSSLRETEAFLLAMSKEGET